MLVSFNSGTTGATSGTGTAYPSGGPELIPCFGGVRVAQSVVFCHSLSFDLRLLCTPLVSPFSFELTTVYFNGILMGLFILLLNTVRSLFMLLKDKYF